MSAHLHPIPWLAVLLILVLVMLNGVLSMSELAIVSSREARLKALARNGSRHPHASKLSLGSSETTMNAPDDSSVPIGDPICGIAA